MTDTNDRVERDFFARPEKEQQDFLDNTWCDECQKENLGLKSPCEYEQAGTLYIEGHCKVCNTVVVTELTDEEF